MSDQLTLQVQKMERQYEDLKKYFAADGKVTPDEQKALDETRAKIDDVRKKAQERAAKASGGDGKPVKANASFKDGKAQISAEAKKDVEKNGFKAGAVVGLHANVAFEVGDPVGEPKRYPVKLTVSFSGSVKGSAGKGAVGVELKGSVERTMVKKYTLTQEQLGGYVTALRAASGGSKVASKHEEFAIIAVGVSQGWNEARNLWKGAGHPTADSVKNKGDSITVTEKDTAGGGAKLKAGGFGGGANTTNSREKVTELKRNDQDGLDYKTDTTNKKENSLSGSATVGVAGLEVGTTHTKQTSFGFSITIDPKHDPDGKILAWLNRCTTQEQYRDFLAANLGKVTLTEQRAGSLESFGTSVGLSLGGRKVAGIHSHQSVSEDVVRDGDNRLVKKTVVGKHGAGGEALWHKDSEEHEAVAEIDGKGKATVTLTTTKTDGDTVDKFGRSLSNSDLKRIGQIACKGIGVWMGVVTLRADEKKDWRAAGEAIARAQGAPGVVAEQLARFCGGDRVERKNTVEKLLRGGAGGEGSIGKRFEFPAALKGLQKSYQVVTAESLPKEMDRLAASDPAAAVDKCKGVLKIIDVLAPQIRDSTAFDNKATKEEMLDRLFNRRKLLAQAVQGYAGKKPEEDPGEEARKLMERLTSSYAEQARVGGKLIDLLAGEKKFLVADLGEAKGLIRQLSEIHKGWSWNYARMQEAQAKLGQPSWDKPPMVAPDGSQWPLFKPNEALLERFRKAAGLS